MNRFRHLFSYASSFFRRAFRDEKAKKEKHDFIVSRKSITVNRQKGIEMPEIYYRKRLIGYAEAVEPDLIPEYLIKNIIKVMHI